MTQKGRTAKLKIRGGAKVRSNFGLVAKFFAELNLGFPQRVGFLWIADNESFWAI